MKKYVLICAWLFALLDWKTVQLTRLQNREWLEWMHQHERAYAAVVYPVEAVLCTPAMALKPILFDAFMSVQAAKEEQEWITHAPRPDLHGFYHLTDRRYSWTFVGWFSWFVYWLPPSLIWLAVVRFLIQRRQRHWRPCK